MKQNQQIVHNVLLVTDVLIHSSPLTLVPPALSLQLALQVALNALWVPLALRQPLLPLKIAQWVNTPSTDLAVALCAQLAISAPILPSYQHFALLVPTTM